MSERKPFLPSEAEDFPAEPGDYLLPICTPTPDVMMGEVLTVVVLETVEGHRIGLPLSMQAVSNLHQALGEALRSLQAPEGGTVQ